MATTPRALMACHLEWDAPMRVGSHHIARYLAKAGWQVAYVSNAFSPFQALRDQVSFRRRARRFRRAGTVDLGGRLWSMAPFAMVTPHNAPLLRSRWVHRHWQSTTLPPLVLEVLKRGFSEVDLLYIDSPGQTFWLDHIDFGVSAARVMDRMGGFHRYPDEMRRLEHELLQRVDVVFYSARDLEAELQAEAPRRLVHLPNGVDFEHFASTSQGTPNELRRIPRPIAIYAGAIDDWFDFAAMNEVTASMSDVSFVLIGPDRLAHGRLDARPNVHILGWRPFDALPAYLHAADVGLIPFDVAAHPRLVHAIHPLKLYEYLAAGLPVVASRWDELTRIESPAVLVEGPAEMEAALRNVLSAPPDRAAGVDFARRADWGARVSTMLDVLGFDPAAKPASTVI